MKIRFFEIAKRLSKSSNHHSHSIGTCVVKKNRIISVGYNTLKTHPSSPSRFKSTHSEFKALWGVTPEDLKGASIYIYRETKNGEPACSYPCSSCLDLIKKMGLKKIYYSNNGGYCEEII